jgi:hypothetical protein
MIRAVDSSYNPMSPPLVVVRALLLLLLRLLEFDNASLRKCSEEAFEDRVCRSLKSV